MREIKFRAWNETKHRMEYDVYKEYENLMQYTGLTDKNGKGIYEGDILQCNEGGIHFNEENYEIRIVKWDDLGWMPFIHRPGTWISCYGEIKEFVVIGNIYENPELPEAAR